MEESRRKGEVAQHVAAVEAVEQPGEGAGPDDKSALRYWAV